ncbi:MAG: 7TM-DISM domain-containing protein, partial [Bacteroidota bacterium]
MKHLLVIFLIIQSYLSFSEEEYTIDSTVNQLNLSSYIYHFEDTSNILTVNQVQKHQWDKLNVNPTFTSNKHIQWISFKIYNPYKVSIKRYLFIPYHLIHEIDVYAVTDSSIINIIKTGIKRPNSNKHLNSIGYPVLINFKPQQTTNVLIRLEFLYRPLRATSYLLSKTRATEIINSNNSLVWFWRGMFLFALVIAIIIYWFVRLKLFLYYIFFNIGVGLFTASQLGVYFLFFNIDSTGFSNIIDFTGTTLICLFLPLFLNELTPIKKRNKVVWKWMYYIIYFMIVIVAVNLIPAVRDSIIMYYSHFYIMFTTGIVLLLILIFLLRCVKYSDKNAIPLLVIYGINTLTAFSEAILPNLGFVEDSPFVLRTLLISTLFEITSFMILMARESLLVYKERSELLEKQREHQKQMIVSMVAGQEDARNRAGRELHDSIGANMAIIKRQIG